MSTESGRDSAERALSRLVEPDTLLPSQHSDRLRVEPSAFPEKRLMLAVLEDGVATYQRYVDASDPRGRRLFEEAEDWIETVDHDWPFSFENICNALQVEAEYVRNGLRRWKEKQLSRNPGARVYRFPFRRVNGSRHSISARDGMRRSA